MDVRNWPLDRIMQLPDHCFGRRWVIACGGLTDADTDVFTIVRTGVPDKCVIWEILVSAMSGLTVQIAVEFAWADQLVTTLAEWTRLQKMFPCQGVQDDGNFYFWTGGVGGLCLRRLRLTSPAAGLRPSVRLAGASGDGFNLTTLFVVSSLPTEVPDCLLSV